MNRLVLPIVPILALAASTPVAAEMFGPGYRPCGEQPNTLATVACVDAKTAVWDKRLNAAYGSLMRGVDAEQRDPLRAAQRLWIQYRDANCRFYGSRQGSISQILAAECVRAMTEDRAIELEQAMKS